jgi:cytoskeletal protein RodZ
VLLWLLAGLIVLGVLIWLVIAARRTWHQVVLTSQRVNAASQRFANASAALEAANAAQRDRQGR